MKLGIIGTGKIVLNFLPHLAKMEQLTLQAILSTPRSVDTAKEIAAQYQIPCVTADFEEFCAAGIDTVYVAVPNHLHFDYCRKALERKLNVIVEKPMTSNDSEAKKLKQIAMDNDCFLFEAITTLYLGNYRKIREWLPRIGTVKLVQSYYSQYSSRYNAFREGEVLPAFDPNKAGGALMDLNLYNIHYLTGLFGAPQDVRYLANVERGIDTSGVLIMEYPGFLGICVGAKDSKGLRGGILQGTDGVIRSEASANLVGKVTLELNDGTVEEFDDGMTPQRMVPEFEAFIKAIDSNDTDFCYKMLNQSILVTEIQTKARLQAGVRFPADDRE